MSNQRTRVSVRITLPCTPEVEAALNNWYSQHKPQFTLLLHQFSKLHFAVHAQRPSPALSEVKELLSKWEDEMLDTVLDLDVDILPKMEAGYLKSTEQFEAAVGELRRHQANYWHLRKLLDTFLDSEDL